MTDELNPLWTELGGQGIERFGGGEIPPVDGDHLPLLDHMHEFDALQGHSGGTEGLESQHRPDDAFNRAMILFH